MKTLKHFFVFAVLFTITQVVMGQEFQVPKNYKFKEAADYEKYLDDVKNCINWLEETPITEKNAAKRKKASAFFIEWIAGTPDVTIEVHPNIVNFTEKNPDLLVTFMGGWTKFVLENTEYLEDKTKGNLAGVKSVIKVYNLNKGKGIKKDKNIEKLIEIDNKGEGELEKWIEEQLKK